MSERGSDANVPAGVDFALPSVLASLDSDDPEEKREALRRTLHTATERPSKCLPTVPKLRAVLDGESDSDGEALVLGTMAELAAASPGDVAPAAADIGRFVAENPTHPAVADALEALTRIATDRPAEVAGHVDAVATALDKRSDDPAAGVGRWGFAVLAAVASETPAAVRSVSDLLVDGLGAPRRGERAEAARTAAHLAVEIDELSPAVESRLRDGMDDGDPTVRANACLAVGYASTDGCADRLAELADTDPDSTVRARAAWALGRMR